MEKTRVYFKDSIATKLLRVIFGFYITVALIVTLTQLVAEYYNVKDNVIEEVKILQTSFNSSLGEALWTFDDNQLKSLLKGIWENQVIVGVKIVNLTEGTIQTFGGFINSQGNYHFIGQEKEQLFPMMKEGIFSELIPYEFPIKYIDEHKNERHVGKGIFYSNNQVVINRVKYGFILIIINSVIKTLALWIIFLLVVHRLLIRPLGLLTQDVAQIDLEHVKRPDFSVETIGHNELKILELTFKSLISKLIHQEKLAAIGELSGNISHEMKNSLGVIDSSVYYLKMRLKDEDEKVLTHLERIKSAVITSDGIIKSLADLTHTEALNLERLNLIDVVVGSMKVADPPETVEVVEAYAEKEIEIDGDPEALGMAFRNIIDNAVRSMDGKGALSVAVKRLDEHQAEVSFADTGPDISKENLSKIFQPLFTTRAKGMGFGLSMTKMIVEKHHGAIHVKSEQGKGVTFTVRLSVHMN